MLAGSCRWADVNNLRLAASGLEVTHLLLNLSMTSKTALPTLGVIPDSRDAVCWETLKVPTIVHFNKTTSAPLRDVKCSVNAISRAPNRVRIP
jgi:hypothetical protein